MEHLLQNSAHKFCISCDSLYENICVQYNYRAGRHGVRMPAEAKDVAHLHNSESGPWSRDVKLPGHEADNSPPSSAEVKNEWSHTSNIPI
jgi:hypothetical protein